VKAGISRVAVEVVILVLAVALALLIFSPVGSFIFGALSRTTMVGGTTQIEIISIDANSSNNLVVVVKNQGPNALSTCRNPANWTFVVKNSTGEYSVPSTNVTIATVSGDTDNNFEVGESWQFTIAGYEQPETSTFTVEVFGPEGTRATQIYRP